jgi:hypothetical protein
MKLYFTGEVEIPEKNSPDPEFTLELITVHASEIAQEFVFSAKRTLKITDTSNNIVLMVEIHPGR